MTNLKAWAEDTALRAVKTAAQAAVALLGADAFNALDADWVTVGSVALGAGIVSILHNLATLHVSADEAPVEHVEPEP